TRSYCRPSNHASRLRGLAIIMHAPRLLQAGARDAPPSTFVAIDAVEARRVAEDLARIGEARLAAERDPRRARLGIVAGGHVMIDLHPLLVGEKGPGGAIHAAEARQIVVAALAVEPRRLVDHQERRCRTTDRREQVALAPRSRGGE